MADSLKLEDIISQYGLSKEKLEEQSFLEIVPQIVTILESIDWKTVGNYLGIPSEELTAVEYTNKTEYQRKVAMLDIWYRREGKATVASCWKLASILNQHGLQNLIESLCKFIQEESSQSAEMSTGSTTSNSGEKIPGSGMMLYCK